MPNYLVAVGRVLIQQEAVRPQDALSFVKQRIEERGAIHDPHIPFSLHETFLSMLEKGQDAPHKLNFLVMDAERTQLLCGEHDGQHEAQVSPTLARKLRHLITPQQLINAGLTNLGSIA